ncbi:MAG: SDR family oxidoreductase [Betaproteobacteria bacterium]|nr:SDR family oxidoreductase [Betaproteobacteria bacterium]
MLPSDAQPVIITGASSGIGAALARHYAARGAILGLIARRERALQALAAGLGGECETFAVDVRDRGRVATAAREFLSRQGCPDIVFANAGISRGTLTECAHDLPAFQKVMDTNLVGLVTTFQPFIGPMRHAGKGGSASPALPATAGYAAAYSASKAAAISYLESLRVEFRASGIKVITICPGYIATPMTEENPYPMPFLMSADAAARCLAAVVAHNQSYAVIPWQMALIARLMRVLPNWLFDRLLSHAPRKPRSGKSVEP